MARRIYSTRLVLRLVLLVIILVLWAVRSGCWGGEEVSRDEGAGDVSTLEEVWSQRRSKVWMEVEGRVERLLPDDQKGSRHQRFIVRAASGITLLVSHNIDLADRVPAELGDSVQIPGLYEWNQQGGVVHWTHHDPKGRIIGGWIILDGEQYR